MPYAGHMPAASEAAGLPQQPAPGAANGHSVAPTTDAAEPAAKRQKVGEGADEEDAGGIREGQVRMRSACENVAMWQMCRTCCSRMPVGIAAVTHGRVRHSAHQTLDDCVSASVSLLYFSQHCCVAGGWWHSCASSGVLPVQAAGHPGQVPG